MPRSGSLIALAALGLWLSTSAAWGTQSATLTAAFTPEKLGAPTALSIGFQILPHGGEIPSPLTAVDLHYPRDLNLATSGLGIATCQTAALEAHGPAVCPANSLMGSGDALARFRVGPEIFNETASLAIVAGASQNGYVRLLIAATGVMPVAARIVMSTLLLPGHLQIAVPLVPSLPEGEDVAVVGVHATLGGNLTYRERVHGRTVAYRPKGFGLPRVCPRGGFGFAATFSFLDGTRADASAVVRCPRSRG